MQLTVARASSALPRLAPVAPWAALGAAAALVFAGLCDAVGDHDGITAVDAPVAAWVAAHRSALEGHASLLLARATSPVVLVGIVLAAAVLLLRRSRRREAAVLVGATVVAYAAGAVAKLGEHRPRPAAPVNLAPESEPSFPSGHVLVVTTIVLVALLLSWHHLGRAGRVLASAAAIAAVFVISADRLVAGAHWLTDVVGAVALAVCVASLAGAVVAAATRPRDAA